MECVKLGDYCDITSSKRVFANQYVEKGVPFYRSREIIEKKEMADISEPLFISEELYETFRKKFGVPIEGDLLLTSVGTLGIPYIVKNERFYFKDGNLTWMKNFKKELSSKYLYYWLNSKFGKESLINRAIGSSQAALTIAILKKYKIFLPTLRNQNQIVDILSAYDNLIENNNKRIKILEQMAENLYKEWFVRFRFPNYQNTEFENGIPKGWNVVRLGEYANISTGKCNREDAEEAGIYPLFDRSQEIKKSNSWIKNCEAIIIPGEGTSFMPRYYVGKFNLHQRCYCIEPKNKSTGKYLFYSLMLNRIYFLYVATGATVPSLRQNNFTSMKIIMPKMSLVKRFDEIISLLFEQINFLEKANEKLSKQRDMLLPRLMNGKLEAK